MTSILKCDVKLSPSITFLPCNFLACGRNDFRNQSANVRVSIHPCFVRLYDEPKIQQLLEQQGFPLGPF